MTELVLGFPTSFATQQMLDKQQALFDVLHNGLVALPIDLPFTGEPPLFPRQNVGLSAAQGLVASHLTTPDHDQLGNCAPVNIPCFGKDQHLLQC